MYQFFPWYIAYKEAWSEIERTVKEINTSIFKQVLTNLYNFVDRSKNETQHLAEIPTAALMTGDKF